MLIAEIIENMSDWTTRKHDLIDRIERCDDPSTILRLESLLDDVALDGFEPPTTEEWDEIREAQRECAAGQGIPHHVVHAEVMEWFQSKTFKR